METNLPKIDLKDRKLLSELDWNARISNTELAKKVGLSKKAIEYRINRLQKEGVIQGYYPIINFGKLGYYSRRVCVKLQNVTSKIKQEIEKYILSKESVVGWAIWTRGVSDLTFVIWTNSLKEFKKKFNKFNTKFGEYIQSREFTSTSGFEQYPQKFLLSKQDEREIVIDEEKSPADLDNLDKEILKELAKNARQNSTDMARKVHSNYKTIKYRIKQLQNKGILLGTRALINNYKLGYDEYVKLMLYFNYYSEDIYKKVKDYFKGRLETAYIVNHIDSDFDVELILKSEADLYNHIDTVNEHFPDLIKKIDFFIFEKTIKISYLPFEQD